MHARRPMLVQMTQQQLAVLSSASTGCLCRAVRWAPSVQRSSKSYVHLRLARQSAYAGSAQEVSFQKAKGGENWSGTSRMGSVMTWGQAWGSH